MTFIGSARRWRPQRFDELIGQDHIRRTLSNALARGRAASAYLFSGTRGVGKTTTARILAKALNCESAEGPVAEPCNACPSCEEINRGSHPDILEIDGATYTGVDHVRDLREGLRYRPARGRTKVLIIDEVHMLSKGAFNALLKTLEEPPPHVVFVFATTEPQRVPETILSRCQVFEFRRIPASVIEVQLARIMSEQGREAEEGALRLLARMGEGSMRDAQSLLDQVLAFAGEGPLTLADVEAVLGVPSSEAYRRLAAAIVDHDGRIALHELHAVFDAGHDLRLFCASLLEFFRDIMVVQAAGKDAGLFDVGPEEIEERANLAGKLSYAEAHLAYSILQSAEFELRTSSHPRMTLEVAILRMASIESIADLGGLIERLEGQLGSPPREMSQAETSAGRAKGIPVSPGGSSRASSGGAARAQDRSFASPPAPVGEKASGDVSPSSDPAGAVGIAPLHELKEAAALSPALPWDAEQARRIWDEAVATLRPARRSVLREVEVDWGEAGRVSLRLPRANGSAPARALLLEASQDIESYFSAHAPWPAQVVVEGSGQSGGSGEPAEATPQADEGGRRKDEEVVIQEVVDLFNGQIVDIRPLPMRSGRAPGGSSSGVPEGENAPGGVPLSGYSQGE